LQNEPKNNSRMADGKINTSFFAKPTYINCSGRLFDLSKPAVAAILNLTPDSFYDGGKYTNEKQIIETINIFYESGAAIIDVGAYSSRPGAEHISEENEWLRLDKVLDIIRREVPQLIISVDTFRAEIARKAKEYYDVSIINDISGGEMDATMFETIAKLNLAYVLMHMQGTPQTMQLNPVYQSVTDEVIRYFHKKVFRLRQNGVNDIILGPGFGFGKNVEHNYELLDNLSKFRIFELPLMAGFSRKSMIQKVLKTTAAQSLNGTTVLNTVALQQGANILRVHDVKEAVEAIELVNMLKKK